MAEVAIPEETIIDDPSRVEQAYSLRSRPSISPFPGVT
jgi:hypothetical protein